MHEGDDPLYLRDGEQAWGMTLRSGGPDHAPLRTFRDDDLLDPGSDPLMAIIGALSALHPGERVVARLLLRSLGPDWVGGRQEVPQRASQPRPPAGTTAVQPAGQGSEGMRMALFGGVALAGLKGFFWVRDGEVLKAALLGLGVVAAACVAGWIWARIGRSRGRECDPLQVREKLSRIAFDGEVQVTAILPAGDQRRRARDLLAKVEAAYRHYDNPAGARFTTGCIRPVEPAAALNPPGPGLFGSRSTLGVREVAALWHPPGGGRRDAACGAVGREGAAAVGPQRPGRGARRGHDHGHPGEIRFPDDLLRRHHLYVARIRMGKSTLMHHIVSHKMREKAAGRDTDAIVVIDPHADLVEALLAQVPASLEDRVRLIDLADDDRSPGINLLDTRVFADRDRTADSVVRVARGLWDQWGPRMQSILEHTVKSLHEANEEVDENDQYTILDGLPMLADESFRADVLGKVDDPYLMQWWGRDFGHWHDQYRADALAPVQTRLSYYASSKRARAILGQSRSTWMCAERSSMEVCCLCPRHRGRRAGTSPLWSAHRC